MIHDILLFDMNFAFQKIIAYQFEKVLFCYLMVEKMALCQGRYRQVKVMFYYL